MIGCWHESSGRLKDETKAEMNERKKNKIKFETKRNDANIL